MKLHDFRCDRCDQQFEELVRELSEARCPACASAEVTRQLSAFSVGGGRAGGAAQEMEAAGCGGGGCGAGACGLR